ACGGATVVEFRRVLSGSRQGTMARQGSVCGRRGNMFVIPKQFPPPVEHTSLRVDRSLRLRLRGVVPRRMDVLPSPGPVGIEDTPAVRVQPDVEAAATRGDAAARLWRIPVEAGFAVGVVGDDEVAVVSDAAREEAELAIHVPAD